MIELSRGGQPLRLFLDAGVIIQGCLVPWGAAKGVLVLATLRDRYTIVLAEAIEREVQRAVVNLTATREPELSMALAQSIGGWLDRVRIERHPFPSDHAIRAKLPQLLPALKHANDLPAIVTAIEARPDWVISGNHEHWNPELARRTHLRFVTPVGFLQHLSPADGS